MGSTDHTLKALNQLEKTIKAQRAQLLQAHGVLTSCTRCCCTQMVNKQSLRAGGRRRDRSH
jgi:hypothetical protein